MTEEMEVLTARKKGFTWSGSTGSSTRVCFLEFQLLRHGFLPDIASSIARENPEVETLADLLRALE